MNSNTSLISEAFFTNTVPTATLATPPPMDNAHRVDVLFIALYVVAGIILLPGLAGNGLITLLVVKVRKLKTPTNYLLASLAVSDLMMMVIMVAFLSYVLLPSIAISSSVNDYLFPSLDIFVGSASIMNLMAVSLDRVIAVACPLRYESIVTPERAQVAIKLIWLYSFVMYIFAMLRIEIKIEGYRDGFIYAAYALSFVIPFIVMIFSYLIIILATVKSLKVTRGLEKVVLSAFTGQQLKDRFKRKQRKRELKTAMALTVILLPFVCGWGFFFGVQIYELIIDEIIDNPIQNWFLYVIPWLNSSLNPIIYILLNRPMRRACKKLLCGRCLQSQAGEVSLVSKTALTRLGSKRCSVEGRPACRERVE